MPDGSWGNDLCVLTVLSCARSFSCVVFACYCVATSAFRMNQCIFCLVVAPSGHRHHNDSTCPHVDFACRHTLQEDDPFFLPLRVHSCRGDGWTCKRICSVCGGRGHEPCSQLPRAGRWELRNGASVPASPQRPLEPADFACPLHCLDVDPADRQADEPRVDP